MQKELIRIVAKNKKTGELDELFLSEDQICYQGRRQVGQERIRGVPHRDKYDCFRYCFAASCDSY